jgi:hypothetical protein
VVLGYNRRAVDMVFRYLGHSITTAMEDWKTWDSHLRPRLLDHYIVQASVDPKGEVREGSYIIIRGFYREVFIMDEPNSSFYEWALFFDNGVIRKKAHMDSREGNRDSTSYFVEDLERVDLGIVKTQLKRHLCLQIVRGKHAPYNGRRGPKILALILECVEGMEDTFRTSWTVGA